MSRLKKENFKTVDVLANTPPNSEDIYYCYREIFVWCLDGAPSKALVFGAGTLQGNINENIARNIGKTITSIFPTATLVYFSEFYIPVSIYNDGDYDLDWNMKPIED